MVDTSSKLTWAEVNKLIRETRDLYGVEIALVITTAGTNESQWKVDALASVLPIMKDGVYVNWWTQELVYRAAREGGRNTYDSLASMAYWTVSDLREHLWSQMEQQMHPL